MLEKLHAGNVSMTRSWCSLSRFSSLSSYLAFIVTKLELTQKLSDCTGLTRKQLEKTLDHFIEIITTELKRGNVVTLTSFGTFYAMARKPRLGVNPKNPSERLQIPAATVAKFKPGKNLKAALRAR